MHQAHALFRSKMLLLIDQITKFIILGLCDNLLEIDIQYIDVWNEIFSYLIQYTFFASCSCIKTFSPFLSLSLDSSNANSRCVLPFHAVKKKKNAPYIAVRLRGAFPSVHCCKNGTSGRPGWGQKCFPRDCVTSRIYVTWRTLVDTPTSWLSWHFSK